MGRVNEILSTLEASSRKHSKPPPYNTKTMFQPRFDVRETLIAYELHGESPGISMRDIDIEFTEEDTITISGKIERTYETGERRFYIPGLNKGAQKPKVTTEEEAKAAGEEKLTGSVTDRPSRKKSPQETAAETALEIAAGGKYWLHEREVGIFSRSFSFPIKVMAEEVEADMRNGVLSVVVPKWKKPPGKKVGIRRRDGSTSRERGMGREKQGQKQEGRKEEKKVSFSDRVQIHDQGRFLLC
jgi:HSP20 family protein